MDGSRIDGGDFVTDRAQSVDDYLDHIAHLTLPELETCDGGKEYAEARRTSRAARIAEQKRCRRIARVRLLAAALTSIVALASLAAICAAAIPSLRGDSTSESSLSSARAAEAPVLRQAESPGETPLFAMFGDVKLRLPVNPDELTEIGFHQASYSYALSMSTPLADADMSDARANRGTGRADGQPRGADAVLQGTVLRMWREGGWGQPDTSADVGAAVGSTVISPVDGTVIKVKPYKLYNKWDDYEIHIQPNGHPELDVVLIHIDKLEVEPGDRVLGGVTPLAVIRRLDDKEPMQLRSYTPLGDGGNHVHVQVNDTTNPGYKGLEGAVTVGN